METINILEKYIVDEIAVDFGIKSLEPDKDLLSSGIIDSMAVMKLVMFLEETFGLEVNDQDIVPENFQDLNSLVEYVEQKKQPK